MKKEFLFLIVLMIAIGAGASLAQNVNVTFLINTATVPDTLKTNSTVQIRGSKAPLTWDKGTGVTLLNVGGDYWKGVGTFKAGDTVFFKIYTNAIDAQADREHKGWEQDLNDPSNNRVLIVGAKDTTLPLQFANGSPAKQNQYWRPYTPTDSIDVWFRVNMQSKEDFDAGTQVMGIRGTNNKDWTKTGDMDWAHTEFLKQESQHGNGGSRQYNGENFWSGRIRVPKGVYTPGQEIEFKFVIMKKGDAADANPSAWADVQMKTQLPTVSEDTTVYWHWWNDKAPAPFKGNDTVRITYNVDMSRAINLRGFSLGDTLRVQSGWGGSGRNLASVSPTNTFMIRSGFTSVYTAKETLIVQKNQPLYYQYYMTKLGDPSLREVYYNFDYKGSDNSLAERRSIAPTSNDITITDNSTVLTDARRQPVFRNTTKLTRVVTVTFTCDLRPAYFQVAKGDTLFDIQGTLHVTNKDSVYKWGVWINGPATGGWATWGIPLQDSIKQKMWDDGPDGGHGDAVKDDRIYSVQLQFGPVMTPASKQIVGQEFKFGIKGGDNEGGKGGFGNNHIENIDDSQPASIIASQFGSINPKYYNAWDFTNGRPVSVGRVPTPPVVYKLDQNFPNPFNPATNIRFYIPTESDVTLKVYNALGQEVKTLVSGPATPGEYMVQFDGAEFSSGFYYYQLKAGSFIETKKMVLTK